MIINVVSTVNGLENEGMRNVAAHASAELSKLCQVRKSPLGDTARCIKNSVGADAVVIFARAGRKTLILAGALRHICRRVAIVILQPPEPDFIKRIRRKADDFLFFASVPEDGREICGLGGRVIPLPIGIDTAKFHPAENMDSVISLRRKYGVPENRPVVLHVGHLSSGRGLEAMAALSGDKYTRVVVASGMFVCGEVEKLLIKSGVMLIKEYLPDVSEVYRMSDVYLFPTRSSEFVISTPLSVSEALACGIPAVALSGVAGLGLISASDGALTVAESVDELEDFIDASVKRFPMRPDGRRSLIDSVQDWRLTAECIYDSLNKN